MDRVHRLDTINASLEDTEGPSQDVKPPQPKGARMEENTRRPENDYSGVEETFSDIIEMNLNPWDAVVTFGLRSTMPTDDHNFKTRVRMPLTQAKVLAVLLTRNIRQLEQRMDVDVDLPDAMLTELGIAKEDWDRFKGLD